MKQLYVIIVCNKYYESRAIPSIETWLRGLSPDEDYILMGEASIPELKMVGFWEDNGLYSNVGWRKLNFMDKYRDYLLQYDWITFVDDDGYLFRSRLTRLLNNYPINSSPLLVGHSLGSSIVKKINNTQVKFKILHGGATISCNRASMQRMLSTYDKKRYHFENSLQKDIRRNGDIALSYLSQMAKCSYRSHRHQLLYYNYKKYKLSLLDMYKIISTHYADEDDKRFLYEIDKNEQLRDLRALETVL